MLPVPGPSPKAAGWDHYLPTVSQASQMFDQILVLTRGSVPGLRPLGRGGTRASHRPAPAPHLGIGVGLARGSLLRGVAPGDRVSGAGQGHRRLLFPLQGPEKEMDDILIKEELIRAREEEEDELLEGRGHKPQDAFRPFHRRQEL